MIVDAHHHLWQLARGYAWLDGAPFAPIRRDFAVDDLRTQLQAEGVDRSVLVEAARETTAEGHEFLAIAESTEEIAGVVAWCDPADPGLADVLAAYRAGPGGRWLVGVRPQVQGEPDPEYLARAGVQRGLRVVADSGLAFDLVVRVDQLAAAASAARAVPELGFVLDHLGKPQIRDGADGLARWRAPLAELAGEPNVTAKLSGLITEADWAQWTVDDLRPYVETALELFGPDRLMFGSDWPVCLLAGSYGQVLRALRAALDGATGPADREAIFAGTAVRAYGLKL